ncbi:MAG TPA: DUF1365 domain-containing protein, partial [Gammaproteobacteria bacterium]|nr:DUF1365 domain-containing protein [Gammaproteobacteria bacterium]
MHRRMQQASYRFVYDVFNLYVDIDELPAIHKKLKLFSYNHFNMFSLFDRDLGARKNMPLRPWLEDLLRHHSIDLEFGKIYLLCYPRVFGYVFNPLSVWYCHHRDGGLRAIVCEVHNTFGETHHYVLAPVNGCAMSWDGEYRAQKQFHVSPFVQMQAEYRFHFLQPGEQLQVLINEYANDAPFMDAALAGTRLPLTDAKLLGLFWRIPFLTLKVIGLIHWQAMKIWLQGASFYRKPSPPTEGVTTGWMTPQK